jgi:hypothetical protein
MPPRAEGGWHAQKPVHVKPNQRRLPRSVIVHSGHAPSSPSVIRRRSRSVFVEISTIASPVRCAT